MKYAFIFSTNVYISHRATVSFADKDSQTEILKVHSFRPAVRYDQHHTSLIINADIDLNKDGNPLKLVDNVLDFTTEGYKAQSSIDRVMVTKGDSVIIDVHQLPEADFDSLQSHIYNEIEVQQPDAVFIVRGEFWVKGHHIIIDNEKLFIDEDSYATGVTNNHEGVLLSPYGLLS